MILSKPSNPRQMLEKGMDMIKALLCAKLYTCLSIYALPQTPGEAITSTLHQLKTVSKGGRDKARSGTHNTHLAKL